MKSIIIALFLVAMAFSFTLAQETKRDYGFKHIEDLRLEGYDFKFMKAGPANKGGCRMGYFKFRWKGNKPINLWGFGFEKDGSFSVRFEMFSKRNNGKWSEVEAGFCGTGAEWHALEANKDYVLQIPLVQHAEEAEQWVVKVGGEKITLISEPFSITAPKKKC